MLSSHWAEEGAYNRRENPYLQVGLSPGPQAEVHIDFTTAIQNQIKPTIWSKSFRTGSTLDDQQKETQIFFWGKDLHKTAWT